MGLLDRIRTAFTGELPADPDTLDWDDEVGSEAEYDGEAVRSIAYDPEMFDTVTEKNEEVDEEDADDEVS